MPIVEIDGVGKVELDDSFLQMSPAQQEATINEIVSSASNSRQRPTVALDPEPAPNAPVAEAPAPDLPPPEPRRTGSTNFDFAAMEEEYQRQLKNQGRYDPAKAPKADKTSFLGAAGLGATDGLSFGFDDEIGSALGAVIPGIGKKSIWDGASLSDAYGSNVDAYRKLKDAAWDEHPGAYIGGGLATAFVPWGAASKLVSGGKGLVSAAKAAEELGTISNKARYAKALKQGVATGALYGAGSDTGNPLDRIDGAATGALFGAGAGVAGEAVIGGAIRALPGNRAARFAAAEAEKNPFASYDAEIVQDLAAATRDRAVSGRDPKGRAGLTAKTINSIEQRYFAEYKNAINGMPDVPDATKLKLKAALTGKYAATLDDINAIRGTVEGDAVAEAIIKVQRLRALTPELKRTSTWLTKAGNAADFLPIPGIVGRSLRGIARAAGDGEAARVNAADKLLAKERGYKKLADMVGPSPQKEADAALWQKVAETADAKEAQSAQGQIEKVMGETKRDVAKRFNVSKKDPDFANFQASMRPDAGELELADMAAQTRLKKQAASKMIGQQERKLAGFDDALNAPAPEAPAPKDPTKKDLADFRKQIEDPTPDMRDATNLIPTERALASRVQSRNKALAKLESGVSDWEAQLADPSTAPKPKAEKPAKAPNAKDAVVEDNISKGIAGDSGTHNAFTSRVEVSKDDLMRIIDKAEQDFPELAGELNRIRFNYPTKDRTFGSAIIPRLKAIRDELGIAPQKAENKAAVTLDEEAQKRLAAAGPDAPKLTGAAAAREADLMSEMVQIDAQKAQRYDADPAYAQIAGTADDPLTSRQVEINAELRKLRQIDRPQQWEQGKSRYQTLANGAIEDLNNDITIGSKALNAIKRVPEKIRDQFKTTDEATAYIENEVVPELEAAKATAEEIDRVKSYLYEIASHKPYATREAYEAGTKANPRGRPRKQQD